MVIGSQFSVSQSPELSRRIAPKWGTASPLVTNLSEPGLRVAPVFPYRSLDQPCPTEIKIVFFPAFLALWVTVTYYRTQSAAPTERVPSRDFPVKEGKREYKSPIPVGQEADQSRRDQRRVKAMYPLFVPREDTFQVEDEVFFPKGSTRPLSVSFTLPVYLRSQRAWGWAQKLQGLTHWFFVPRDSKASVRAGVSLNLFRPVKILEEGHGHQSKRHTIERTGKQLF